MGRRKRTHTATSSLLRQHNALGHVEKNALIHKQLRTILSRPLILRRSDSFLRKSHPLFKSSSDVRMAWYSFLPKLTVGGAEAVSSCDGLPWRYFFPSPKMISPQKLLDSSTWKMKDMKVFPQKKTRCPRRLSLKMAS